MRHETAQVFIGAGADTNAIERTLAARVAGLSSHARIGFARNLEGSWGAGDYTLDLVPGDDAPACDDVFADLATIAGVTRIDHVGCLSIGGSLRDSGLRDGIWRTLMLRVRVGASDTHVAALERELLQMPEFMAGIRNWRLSRVATPGTWTHVWQQEFARADDLLGEYLLHPFHWGWVDRWFDAEHPQWTVEAISHAFCPLASSLLTVPAS
ncbi:Dabb family protein [Paraburkholderia oxyphila]|uniref:Dabb family protein n=1 Tax=Paraburkholderia oxyphila TaxID=614212 RepID=UPI000484023A|nr:Dabb family protein [Paraburkholderia oxyphila]